MLELQQNIPLAPLTTFQIGGSARFFAEAHTEDDVLAAVTHAETNNLPLFILGGGSNLLVPDTGYPGLVLQIKIPGITSLGSGLFQAGAGVSWDEFVTHSIAAQNAGIECLAGIPGSVGGTPVQNAGAYGQEVSETIASVRAFDRQTHTFVDLPKSACNFRYRASLFNTDQRNRYIVTRVTFQLHPGGPPALHYADLKKHFAADPKPTLSEVASAVREIRRSKGMLITPNDPNSRSAGSFFKNPIVDLRVVHSVATVLLMDPHNIHNWPTGDHKTKLPAAWLLEQAGFVKGYGSGPVGISSRHTLALVNRGQATFADVEALQEEITAKVQQMFGITLEREPVLLA